MKPVQRSPFAFAILLAILTACANAPPSTPGGLQVVSRSYNSISLTWRRVSGASSYELRSDTSASGPFSRVAYSGSATSFTDGGLPSRTSYYYKVRAVNTAGASGYSAPVLGTTDVPPPATPAGLAAAATVASTIDLTWSAAADATGYELYRAASAGGPFDVKVYDGPLTSCGDSPLPPLTTFWYKVLAKNSSGASALSPAASQATLDGPPVAPLGLTASAATPSTIDFRWDPAFSATGYELHRSDSSGGTYAKVYDGASTSCQDSGLSASTTYYYKILAKNANGSSAFSIAVSATTTVGIPATPADLAVSWVGGNSVGLSWSASTYATGYEVYLDTQSGGSFASQAYSGTATNCEVQGLSLATPYYFKVLAKHSGGSSALSAAVSATTTNGIPAAPQGFAVSGASANSLTLAWQRTIDATEYVLTRSTQSDGTYVEVYRGGALTCVDDDGGNGLAASTVYYYKLQASSQYGSSPEVGPVSYTTGDVPATITIH